MKISLEKINNLLEVDTTTLVYFLSEEYVKNYINKNGKCICGLSCKCGEKCDCQKYPIQEAYYEYNFSGKFLENAITGYNVYVEKNKISKVILIGLGAEKDFSNIKMEEVGFKTFQYMKKLKIKNATFLFNLETKDDKFIYLDKINKLNIKDLYSHLIFGFDMASYKFNKYKKENNKNDLEEAKFVVSNIESYQDILNSFNLIKENVFYCRNLINEPANIVNPEYLVKEANNLKKLKVKVSILDVKAMKKLHMDSLLSVGQGSDNESKMIVLQYNNSKTENPIAFVGKGVCFDSGGLSLKPSSSMEDMKTDMSGAAVVLSTIRLLAMRKANVNVVGIMPLVENMPSGKATKVGDIVNSMSGQTIEIMNTDAEGRMILADALYYVVTKFNPKIVIDLATLTGAICVALGEKYSGLFTNSNDLYEDLNKAGNEVGEYVWRMPLSEIGTGYDKLINSDFADVRNTGKNRYAGAITAAQFLQRFINKHNKWAHIDIAGTSYIQQEGFLTHKYATGYGVRLLNEFIKKYEFIK